MHPLGYHTVYFLGIGGIGMSSLARYFQHNGCTVTGYDRTSTPLTKELEQEGIRIHYEDLGPAVADTFQLNIKDTLVVYTPAIPKDFKELNFLRDQGYPMKKRSVVLGMICDRYKTIAVAGTHGKTTTSTLIAHLLQHSGRQVLAFLGGISSNYKTNLLLPELYQDVICVAEADEYDRSFLHLHPDISIITSTDADHLDIYGNQNAMVESFNDFAGNTRKDGLFICRKDLPVHAPVETLSYQAGEEAERCGVNITIRQGTYYFDYSGNDGTLFKDLELGIPGWHNVENAVAAITATLRAGLTEHEIRQGLKSFTGVRRRFEYIIKTKECNFIDDYAHHPQELHAIITSTRELYPTQKIIGVFQPHLFTRTRDFVDGFAASLNLLDEVILLDIYPAREIPIEGVTSSIILDKLTIPAMLCAKQELVSTLLEKDLEVLLTLGAGDIDMLVPVIGQALRMKALEADLKGSGIQFTVNEPMTKHTWLKIGGPADLFAKPKNNKEIEQLMRFATRHSVPAFILGNGSNLLVGDKGIRGMVIAVGESETYMKQEGDLFHVSASYSLPKFVLDTLKLGYEGIESLAGVPCTIGGATRMNAGAYGMETFDHLQRVTFLRNGKIMQKDKADIEHSYRHTEFETEVILETTFCLIPSTNIEAVALKRKELLEKRKEAQPLDKPNTGSVFKNPLPSYAGKLIEDAGLKGIEHGRVQVSPRHANFIVNNGGATAKEFMELVSIIKKKVKQQFDIELHTEVLFVGEF